MDVGPRRPRQREGGRGQVPGAGPGAAVEHGEEGGAVALPEGAVDAEGQLEVGTGNEQLLDLHAAAHQKRGWRGPTHAPALDRVGAGEVARAPPRDEWLPLLELREVPRRWRRPLPVFLEQPRLPPDVGVAPGRADDKEAQRRQGVRAPQAAHCKVAALPLELLGRPEADPPRPPLGRQLDGRVRQPPP